MQRRAKAKLIATNTAIWIASFVVPYLIRLIPTSHPPRIYPLVFGVFWVVLVALSNYLLSSAIGAPTDE